MNESVMPRYPIYIPSKGDRVKTGYTMIQFLRDEVPFYLVVEPQDYNAYFEKYGREELVTLLQLPENDQGLIYARNWIRDHSMGNGDKRHWQIDDNIGYFFRRYRARRIHCASNYCFAITEDFADRYTNVGLAGLQYEMFAMDFDKIPPFSLNVHVYSTTLFLNELPYKFRPPANEDVDMCLQVLSGGWCTVLMNIFLAGKKRTMKVPGGQTDTAYKGDGRLFMAKAMERKWPGVVTVARRFGRPQHRVAFEWKRFDTQLIRRPDLDWEQIEQSGPDNYGMKLRKKKDEVKGEEQVQLYADIGEPGVSTK